MTKTAKLEKVALLLNYLSTFILLIALSIGLFVRWSHGHSDATVILALAFLSLFVMAICLAMRYYFSIVGVSRVLSHIWVGCLIGVVAFTENPDHRSETVVQIMDALFLTSFALKTCWHIVQRLLKLLVHKPILLSLSETFELLGIAIPTLVSGNESTCLAFLILSLSILTVSIRFKSAMGVLCLALFTSATVFHVFPKLGLNVNMFCLTSFIGRVTIEALLDLFFSPLSILQHWQVVLRLPQCSKRLIIIVILCLEVAFCSLTAYLMPRHKEWVIVVPIFTAFAILWLCFHTMFTISLWKLMNRISDSYVTFNNLSAENRSINSIMASKGIRHFSLVVDRLVLLTLVSTAVLLAIGWTTKQPCNIGLFTVVFPLECMVYSFVLEMGSCLGGTCTGYALVIPVSPYRTNENVTLLPMNKVEEISSQSTQLIHAIQRFFNHLLIDNFGCDYCSSGMSVESLDTKLRAFFSRRTSDGPRFDTYVVYYSGGVHDSGDWALANNDTLTLHTLMELWSECNAGSGARLILILETKQSTPWIKQIKSECGDNFVAIQTLQKKKSKDLEAGQDYVTGEFTKVFLQANIDDEKLDGKDLNFQLVYKTSRYWTDFAFHLPTPEDMLEYWEVNFPRFTKPLMVLVTCGRNLDLFCCSVCLIKCLRRKKHRWFPPSEQNTGHGFKLISF